MQADVQPASSAAREIFWKFEYCEKPSARVNRMMISVRNEV
jgi:hypothetical protein